MCGGFRLLTGGALRNSSGAVFFSIFVHRSTWNFKFSSKSLQNGRHVFWPIRSTGIHFTRELFLKIETVASNRNSRCSGQTDVNRPVLGRRGRTGRRLCDVGSVVIKRCVSPAPSPAVESRAEKNSISFEQFYFDWRWACPLGQHKSRAIFAWNWSNWITFHWNSLEKNIKKLKFSWIQFLKFFKIILFNYFHFLKRSSLMRSFKVHLNIQMTLGIN